MTEDSAFMSLELTEWSQSISDSGLGLMGYFQVASSPVAELSNGTKLSGMPIAVSIGYQVLVLERGIGTIKLVDVTPDNVCANADLFLRGPHYDELWKHVRQGVYAECELGVYVAPVLRREAGWIWNVSERTSLFILSGTIRFTLNLPRTGGHL